MNVVRQLFVASRPVSWVNTAYPFAAAYLMTVREVDLTLIVGTLFFLVPYNLAMWAASRPPRSTRMRHPSTTAP